jgi:hypothetical protein
MNPSEYPLQIFERLYSELIQSKTGNSGSASEWMDPPSSLSLLPASNLHCILRNLGHLPSYSVLLGICPDGAPLFIDLSNPAPGSILVLGRPDSGKTNLIKVVMGSASELNPPEMVNYFIISNEAQELRYLAKYPHCQGIYSHFHRESEKIILGLSALTEQRRLGRERGPAIILAIEDLSALTQEYMDYNLFVHLKWLLRFGPSASIWPFISLDESELWKIDNQLISSFTTRLVCPPALDHPTFDGEQQAVRNLIFWQAQSNQEVIPFTVPTV